MTLRMKISRLEPSRRRKGIFLVNLEDGSLLRVREGETAQFALYAGKELDGETLEQLRRAARTSDLKERALSALERRPLSRKELVDRLLRAEAAQAEAEEVADSLERLGLLNDREYAETVVRHYAGKGYGPYKIREELYRRGISRDYWEDVLSVLEDPAEAIDALLRKQLAGQETDPKTLKRVAGALARRGYRWTDINAGLRRFGADHMEED